MVKVKLQNAKDQLGHGDFNTRKYMYFMSKVSEAIKSPHISSSKITGLEKRWLDKESLQQENYHNMQNFLLFLLVPFL
jgi:hypothetical protein